TVGTGQHARDEWQPQGHRVGWLDREALYLEPEAAYAEVQCLAGEHGDSLAVSARTLWKGMRERGLLASRDAKRERNTVRRTLEKVRGREVIHLRADLLCSPEPATPSTPSTGGGAAPENTGSVDGSCGRFSGQVDGFPEKPSTGTVHTNGRAGTTDGACGRFGRSHTGEETPQGGSYFPAGANG